MTTVCLYCERVKDPDGNWTMHWSDADLMAVINIEATHGCCPECLEGVKAALSFNQRELRPLDELPGFPRLTRAYPA